jgi:hypothetical protein
MNADVYFAQARAAAIMLACRCLRSALTLLSDLNNTLPAQEANVKDKDVTLERTDKRVTQEAFMMSRRMWSEASRRFGRAGQRRSAARSAAAHCICCSPHRIQATPRAVMGESCGPGQP